MRVIEIKEHGGPDVLTLGERPKPKPGPGEILIAVDAAGINRPDLLQRQGFYPPPPGASDIPGLEVAGTVAELGDGVFDWRIGDSVCALVSGGGYAEYCVAHAGCCLPIPQRLTAVEAAGVPETFFTVWSNVFERGALEAGETILIHGGASGIGTTAIQLANQFSANVIVTAGSDAKVKACEGLGADLAINYREEDFVEAVRGRTNELGVNVILDMVGGDYLPKNIDLLAEEGRLVSIAFLRGPTSEINIAPIMTKRLTLTGSTLRARSADFKAMLAESLSLFVWPLLEQGEVRPVIDKVFPLEEAADAHRYLDSGDHIGKVILRV